MLAGVEQVGDIDGGKVPRSRSRYPPTRGVPRHFSAVAGESVAHVFILDGQHAVLASGAERHIENEIPFFMVCSQAELTLGWHAPGRPPGGSGPRFDLDQAVAVAHGAGAGDLRFLG